jgi:hypothetical protein
MEQLIELLQQIMDLAGAGIEALQGAAADAGGGGEGPPEGGAPSEGAPEGGSGAPSEEQPPRQ